MQKNLKEISHALVVVRVNVVVPLFEPQDEFGNTSEQWCQALYGLAFLYKPIS